MGLFSSKSSKQQPAKAPQDTPPAGGTAHQRRVAAGRREHELMKAISDRGRALGLDAERVVTAQRAAREELRRRGQAHEQLPPGDPVDDFVRYGI